MFNKLCNLTLSPSYLVLLSGFYFAPQRTEDDTFVDNVLTSLPLFQSIKTFFGL